MVKLIARVKAKPGQEQFLADAMRELVGPSREEAGCILYDVCVVKGEPAELLVLEEWESQDALDQHMATPHFKAFLAKVGDALAGEPELQFIERV